MGNLNNQCHLKLIFALIKLPEAIQLKDKFWFFPLDLDRAVFLNQGRHNYFLLDIPATREQLCHYRNAAEIARSELAALTVKYECAQAEVRNSILFFIEILQSVCLLIDRNC